MALSEKLRQARLDAGLSQRQLCGDRITRNMLSQIENGSARPSMDTLKYLAERLGKSVSYFLEETAITSPNQVIMEKARAAEPSEVLALFGHYQTPDPVFDRERWLMEVLACLSLAENAVQSGRREYARSLLERAGVAGGRTPYYTEELERKRLLLALQAGMEVLLPDISEELTLRAECALREKEYARCAALLEACREKSGYWYLLRGQTHLEAKAFPAALDAFSIAQSEFPRQCLEGMEHCYRELGDFRGAYECACKLREASEHTR